MYSKETIERLNCLATELAWFHELAESEDYIDYAVSGKYGCLDQVRKELDGLTRYLEKKVGCRDCGSDGSIDGCDERGCQNA